MNEPNLDTLFDAILSGGPTEVVGKTDVDGITVSTVFTTDMGYETALCDKYDVHPVERYTTRDEAFKGHLKWTKEAETATMVLKLGYGDLVDAKQVELVRA